MSSIIEQQGISTLDSRLRDLEEAVQIGSHLVSQLQDEMSQAAVIIHVYENNIDFLAHRQSQLVQADNYLSLQYRRLNSLVTSYKGQLNTNRHRITNLENRVRDLENKIKYAVGATLAVIVPCTLAYLYNTYGN